MFSAAEKAMKKLNSEDAMGKWLKEFLVQLERTSSRSAQCRLILSVERMEFLDHEFATQWQYVRFGTDKSKIQYLQILDKDRAPLQKMNITEFQRMIWKNDEFLNKKDSFVLSRSSIKPETGEWASGKFKSKKISEGGEALVFSEKFEDFTTAVRVHIFDSYLFTQKFGLESQTWKAHFDKGLFIYLC